MGRFVGFGLARTGSLDEVRGKRGMIGSLPHWSHPPKEVGDPWRVYWELATESFGGRLGGAGVLPGAGRGLTAQSLGGGYGAPP